MQAFTTSGCSFCTGTNLQYTRPQARQQAAVSHYVLAKATTKASDFRRLTTEEIDQQVQAAKRSLMIDFRVPQVKSQVAQLLTVKRERELADNIGKRESRSKQQSRNILAGFGNIR